MSKQRVHGQSLDENRTLYNDIFGCNVLKDVLSALKPTVKRKTRGKLLHTVVTEFLISELLL